MSNPADVSFREAVIVWFRIGILSFGGPAAQISLLHNIVVEEKRWISEKKLFECTWVLYDVTRA